MTTKSAAISKLGRRGQVLIRKEVSEELGWETARLALETQPNRSAAFIV